MSVVMSLTVSVLLLLLWDIWPWYPLAAEEYHHLGKKNKSLVIYSSGGTPEARSPLLWSFCVTHSAATPVLTRGGYNPPKQKTNDNTQHTKS
jgi:hypothetical protein